MKIRAPMGATRTLNARSLSLSSSSTKFRCARRSKRLRNTILISGLAIYISISRAPTLTRLTPRKTNSRLATGGMRFRPISLAKVACSACEQLSRSGVTRQPTTRKTRFLPIGTIRLYGTSWARRYIGPGYCRLSGGLCLISSNQPMRLAACPCLRWRNHTSIFGCGPGKALARSYTRFPS